MLTPPVDPVDAPRTVMWSVSEIADRDHVSKQAVSKRVRELIERNGLEVERNGLGHVTAVNVAQYDYLRSRYGDPSKAQAPDRSDDPDGDDEARARTAGTSDGYDEALRQKTWIAAETSRLALNELRGNLVRRDRMEAALRSCAEKIARPFDQLVQEADTLATAYDREGLHGLRVALKKLGREGRERMADALEAAIPAAPATDDPLPFTEGRLL